MKKILTYIFLAASLIGCSAKPPVATSTTVKRYPMHGTIVSVNAAEKSARIDAGPIGDYMGAMTMNYQIKDDAALAKLAAGSVIDATVFVDGDNSWVGEIQPAAASAGTGR